MDRPCATRARRSLDDMASAVTSRQSIAKSLCSASARDVYKRQLVHSSGGNVDWLMEQGVKFSGVVDDYHGNSAYPDFHWFDGDVASSGYIPQMLSLIHICTFQPFFSA